MIKLKIKKSLNGTISLEQIENSLESTRE